MSKSISRKLGSSKTSSPPPPAQEKTAANTSRPPKMSSKKKNEIVTMPDGRRYKGGLELGRETESDEENKFEALPDKNQKSPNTGNKNNQEREKTKAPTTSTQSESQIKAAEINTPAHNSENDYAQLESAIKTGNIDAVRQLIGQNSRLIPDAYLHAQQPLLQAIYNNQADIAKILINADAPVDCCNREGVSGLMEVIRQGQTDLAKLMIRKGVAINVDFDGVNAIDLAIQTKNHALVKLLISDDKEIKQSKGYLYRLLTGAIGTRDPKIIEIVINSALSISLEFELNSNLLLKLVNPGQPKLVELFLKKLDRTALDSEAMKNTMDTYFIRGVLSSAALMAESAGHSEVFNSLIKAGAVQKKRDFNQAISDACRFLRLVNTDALTETATQEFCDSLSRNFDMDYVTAKNLLGSLKQHISAYAESDQHPNELIAQQLKMIFLACVTSSDALHELTNLKEQDAGLEDFYYKNTFGGVIPKVGLLKAWETNILLSKAQSELDQQQQPLQKLLTQLSPSVKTAQLRDVARSAGWHPMVIRMMTDIWTSLARRKTKDNFFAAINAQLNSSEWLNKMKALESDAARHIIRLQLDQLKNWINSPSGNNIVTKPTA